RFATLTGFQPCALPISGPFGAANVRVGPGTRCSGHQPRTGRQAARHAAEPGCGELYVISPEAHGLQVINTWTHEVGDYMVLGAAPTRGVLSNDAGLMYVSDTAAGRVTPVDILNRRIIREALSEKHPEKGFP